MKPTREEILAMAKEAGFTLNYPAMEKWIEIQTRFYNLAYTAGQKVEMEAAAKVCLNNSMSRGIDCAAAIRARKDGE